MKIIPFGIIATLFFMTNANALECIIEGKSPAIKVQWANKEYAVFRQMASSNCEGAKIIEGDAIIYYSGESGNSMRVELSAGQSISPSMLKTGESYIVPIYAVIAQMSRILSGDKRIVTGQKRAFAEEQDLNGFPYGAVLPPNDFLEIDIGRYSNTPITKFVLVDVNMPSKPIYSNNSPDRTIKIPSNQFGKNGRYQWMAKMGEKEFRGKFRISSENEEQLINSYRHELDETNKTLTPLGKAILEAGLYSYYGYEFDSARILGRALR